MYTIYKYTNTVNGKIYIGQTSRSMEERAQSNGSNYRGSRLFYNAIKKYGWDKFKPEIICYANTVDEANYLEEKYIKEYNSTNRDIGYNLLFGGLNRTMQDETRLLISQKAKERQSDPTRNPMYGKHHSDEAKKKQSDVKLGEKNPMYGTHWTERQRELCGTKGKKLNLTDEQRSVISERSRKLGKENAKRIFCVEDETEFSSATEAAKYYCVDVSTLCGAANGKQKTCCGKHFYYVINN